MDLPINTEHTDKIPRHVSLAVATCRHASSQACEEPHHKRVGIYDRYSLYSSGQGYAHEETGGGWKDAARAGQVPLTHWGWGVGVGGACPTLP